MVVEKDPIFPAAIFILTRLDVLEEAAVLKPSSGLPIVASASMLMNGDSKDMLASAESLLATFTFSFMVVPWAVCVLNW